MAIARRLYFYLVAGAALALWTVGTVWLLRALFIALWELLAQPAIVTDPEVFRRQVSVSVALLVVGFPIWVVHWWLVQRSLRDDNERRSAIRAFFFTAVLLVTFGFWLSSATEFLRLLLLRLSGLGGAPEAGPVRMLEELAVLLPTLAVWVAHARVARAEHRSLPLHGPADWFPRLYAYGAAAVGLSLLVVGAAGLLETGLAALFGGSPVFGSFRWQLATDTALAVAGLVAWSLHWGESLGLVAGPAPAADRERRASLRWIYLGFVVFASLAGLLVALAVLLETVLRWALGVTELTGASLARALLDPLAWALPLALVWWYHRTTMQREASVLAARPQVGADWAFGVTRALLYLAAFAGLAFAVFGVGALLGFFLRVLVAAVSGTTIGPWRDQLAFVLSTALVGGAAWLWFWRQVLRRTLDDPGAEAASLSRRVYLYGTLGLSVLVILGAAGVVVYRLVTWFLGISTASAALSAAAPALGYTIVAAAVLAFHLAILLADARTAAQRPVTRTVQLVLRLPPDSDPDAVLRDLADRLPPGAVLERAT
ncbi:MAG: DUF5671 domain-containing protein [Thermomicrobium sp.]|nr:DUF5671 domain-containing protein [Thermomicrobium sp.]MDW8059082.1 DUF5671 domain-containing protein [Thermomicrobium sp.]